MCLSGIIFLPEVTLNTKLTKKQRSGGGNGGQEETSPLIPAMAVLDGSEWLYLPICKLKSLTETRRINGVNWGQF